MEAELLRIMLYFDIFNYPLTRREIVSYSSLERDRWKEVKSTLARMVKEGVIGFYRGFYYVGRQRQNVTSRLEGNRRMKKRMRTARRYSGIISGFPFVRGVFISGSLSKGAVSETDDIDYFIITDPGRLWLVRSLLTLFKKMFLLNSYRNFCINYFVDSENLYVRDHNLFTATEIVFLIPVFNRVIYDRFMDQNTWVRSYYPNIVRRDDFCHERNPVIKRLLEKLPGNSTGNRLESYFYRTSGSYIRRKFSYMDDKTFSQSFTLLRNELKYLPQRHKNRIIDKYNERVLKFRRLNWFTPVKIPVHSLSE